MPKLTQRRFSELLCKAMDDRQIQGKDLAAAAGVDAVTISRWRSPTYTGGPPPSAMRRVLERQLGLAQGTLDGKPTRQAAGRLNTAVADSQQVSEPPPDYDARVERIAGTVARVIAQAIHNAVAEDEATKTRKGQQALGRALSHFAAELDDQGFSVSGLIRVADMLRDGQL